MILEDGTDWEPTDEDFIAWQRAYPTVDIYAEYNAMCSWADANPQKRKTRRGAKRFVNSWLNRASQMERGISPFAQQKTESAGKIAHKEMSHLDMITHDFMNNEAFRAYCLQTYGQYVTLNGERVTL